MQRFKFWQVDSFTHEPFKGNPAAVVIHDEPLDEELMQKIAMEMHLPETAFVYLRGHQHPQLRWFTPLYEMDLCGHATLAAAKIYFSAIDPKAVEVRFSTKFVGDLSVQRKGTRLTLNFPLRAGEKICIDSIPGSILEYLSSQRPIDARRSRDLMLVFEHEETILEMAPHFGALRDCEASIIVTAASKSPDYDFVSRFFCPSDSILEDPVTGSAHCTLAPYWAAKLGKSQMRAFQASKRGGLLYLDLEKDRVNITGEAVTIIEGVMTL